MTTTIASEERVIFSEHFLSNSISGTLLGLAEMGVTMMDQWKTWEDKDLENLSDYNVTFFQTFNVLTTGW